MTATTVATVAAPNNVYAMRMYSERLQILISKEQRRRLEQEAKRRGASVASVIRDAVDDRLGGVTRDDRIAAVEAIAAIEGLPSISVEEMNRMLAEAHDEATRFPPEGAPG